MFLRLIWDIFKGNSSRVIWTVAGLSIEAHGLLGNYCEKTAFDIYLKNVSHGILYLYSSNNLLTE